VSVAVVMTGVLVLLGRLLDHHGLGGARCTNTSDVPYRRVRHRRDGSELADAPLLYEASCRRVSK
jgi:hypothetical protein